MVSNRATRKTTASVGTLAIALSLTACGAFQEEESSETSGTVTVGILAPQSGALAEDGTSYVKAATAALETLGEENNIDIEVKTYDEASSTGEAVNGTKRLIQNEGASAILSASTSGNFLATRQIIDQAEVPVLTIATSAKVVEGNAGWTFRVSQPIPERIADNVKFASETLQAKSVAFLQVNDESQKAFVKGMAEQLPSIGATSVAEQYFQYTDSDFTPYLQELGGIDADAAFLGCEVTQCAAILDQAHKAGVQSSFVLPTAASSDDFLANFGDVAEEAYVQTIYAPGAVPETADFEELAEKGGFVASYYSIIGYTEAKVLVDAIKEAGSGDPKDVKDALASGEFTTPLGAVSFEDNGQGTVPGYVAQIQDSKYVKVWPTS